MGVRRPRANGGIGCLNGFALADRMVDVPERADPRALGEDEECGEIPPAAVAVMGLDDECDAQRIGALCEGGEKRAGALGDLAS